MSSTKELGPPSGIGGRISLRRRDQASSQPEEGEGEKEGEEGMVGGGGGRGGGGVDGVVEGGGGGCRPS